MRLLGLILLASSAVVAWDFVLNYWLRAKWKSHPYGWIMLGFMASITLVLTLAIFNGFFMHYPGRGPIRIIAFSVFIVAFIILDLFLRHQLKEEKRDERRAEVDRTTQ